MPSNANRDIWPDLGSDFELNQFYRSYLCSEGWVGECYLCIWTPEEIKEFGFSNLKTFPQKYNFFASNGGGTQFAFHRENGAIYYISAPDIGDATDIRELGDWEQFWSSIVSGDYI